MWKSQDPYEIFRIGTMFIESAAILGKYAGGLGIVPSVVNRVFGVELYLKAFLTIEKVPIPHTHNIHTLFNQLSATNRSIVEQYYEEEFAKDPEGAAIRTIKTPFSFDLEEVLMNSRNAFVEWRYVFEEDGGLGSYGLGEFQSALHRRLCELQPDWQSRRGCTSPPFSG